MYLTDNILDSGMSTPIAEGMTKLVTASGDIVFNTGSFQLIPVQSSMSLTGGLEWTAATLLIMIGLVSLRILLTKNKMRKELKQLSEIEKYR